MNEDPRKVRLDRARAAAKVRRDKSLARSRARIEASRARQASVLERRRRSDRDIALVDLVDRLLDGGVVIHGDITLAVADVDLLYVGLRALVASVETIERETGVSLSARGPSLDRSAL
jgi:gas vesicle structural protein